MRILKTWNQNTLKLTLFQYQMKYSLKIEDGHFESILKLGDLSDFDINRLEEACKNEALVNEMHAIRKSALLLNQELIGLFQEKDEDFMEII